MNKQKQYLNGISLNPEHKKKQIQIFSRTKLTINIIAGSLGLIFGYLQLSGLEVEAFKTDGFADTLMKITLLIYYIAWYKGTLMDLKDEEDIFILPPNKGKYTTSAIFLILFLAIAFFLTGCLA